MPAEPWSVRQSADPSKRAHGSLGPVYVGGLDRSGKTTMSGYLASHPSIAIPPVGSNMWTYFYGRFGDLAVRHNYERCISALLCYKHVRILEPDPSRIEREFRQGPPTYARLFALLLMHYAEQAGKPRWGAQTGLIERYADQMFEAYSELRIVHMIRDPRDRYLASLERWPEGRGRAGGATGRWRYSTRLGERHTQRYPGRYLMVRFEDLIAATEPTLRMVCSFVGEEFRPEMLSMGGAPKHKARLVDGSSNGRPDALLSPEHIGRYRGRLPIDELAFIQLHAGRQMARHGYEPDVVECSGRSVARRALVDWPNQFARMAAWRTIESLQQRFPRLVGRKPGRRMMVDQSADTGQ